MTFQQFFGGLRMGATVFLELCEEVHQLWVVELLAPRHSLRDKVTRREEAEAPEETAPAEKAVKKKRLKPPRLNWAELQRRTFKEDVFLCRCGGKRKIRAIIENHEEARAVLKRMGVPMPPGVKRVEAQSPPDRQLSLAH